MVVIHTQKYILRLLKSDPSFVLLARSLLVFAFMSIDGTGKIQAVVFVCT